MRPKQTFLWSLLVPILITLCHGNTSTCEEEKNKSLPLWIEDGGVIVLIIGLLVAFWGLAVVCEDYFVPGLHY
jgi:hypothetical protein